MAEKGVERGSKSDLVDRNRRWIPFPPRRVLTNPAKSQPRPWSGAPCAGDLQNLYWENYNASHWLESGVGEVVGRECGKCLHPKQTCVSLSLFFFRFRDVILKWREKKKKWKCGRESSFVLYCWSSYPWEEEVEERWDESWVPHPTLHIFFSLFNILFLFLTISKIIIIIIIQFQRVRLRI